MSSVRSMSSWKPRGNPAEPRRTTFGWWLSRRRSSFGPAAHRAPYDTLLVAGSPDFSRAESYTDFQEWLRRRVVEVPRYGSVCTGAFFLGAAGLLDGRNRTTHWQHAAELAARYPAAKVGPDQIYVKDGQLYTSAGATAGIDLALW